MKKIISSLLVAGFLSSSFLSTSMAGLSENTKSGSELSGTSVLLSGPLSIVFMPIMASGLTASAVSDSLIFLGTIGNAISINKVERKDTTTVVYGTAVQKITQQKVDIKFDVPNKIADKAKMQPNNDIKLQKTPMGTLITYDNKSLGFAAGTENNNNMKSTPVH